MNLRELAEADNAIIVEDDVSGFGVAIMLTDPAGPVHQVKGQFSRVGVDIDPETGLLVAGNKSAVTVRGRASSVMLDRTAGRATIIMKR